MREIDQVADVGGVEERGATVRWPDPWGREATRGWIRSRLSVRTHASLPAPPLGPASAMAHLAAGAPHIPSGPRPKSSSKKKELKENKVPKKFRQVDSIRRSTADQYRQTCQLTHPHVRIKKLSIVN